MSKPLVSVLIDTYNHERFIEQAITSVLEQSMPMSDVEVVVVDDGSTDGTPDLVRRFEPRVRLLRKTNGGQASAFNNGIPECRGEIISFLDGDDWWAREKLRRVIDVFETDPEVGMVGHGIIEAYPDGRQHSEVLRETSRFRLDSTEGAKTFRLRKSFLGTSRLAIRARLAPLLLPVPEPLWFEADEYLFTMASAAAPVVILPEALTFYRIHGANLFQVSGFRAESIRRKQRVLVCLAGQLRQRLRERGLTPESIRIVINAVSIEADQLRLMVDGGYPWETVRAESAMYRLLHSDASLSHRAFKYASLAPAYLLPPRLYYMIQRWFAANKLYLRMRRNLLPVPQPQHTVREWK